MLRRHHRALLGRPRRSSNAPNTTTPTRSLALQTLARKKSPGKPHTSVVTTSSACSTVQLPCASSPDTVSVPFRPDRQIRCILAYGDTDGLSAGRVGEFAVVAAMAWAGVRCRGGSYAISCLNERRGGRAVELIRVLDLSVLRRGGDGGGWKFIWQPGLRMRRESLPTIRRWKRKAWVGGRMMILGWFSGGTENLAKTDG